MPGSEYRPTHEECVYFRKRSGLPLDDCELLLVGAYGEVELALKWILDGRPLPRAQWFSYFCPSCGQGSHSPIRLWECSSCGWLRHRTRDRDKWGQVGRCPHCGFSYRWDGGLCSHCGYEVTAERGVAP